MTAFDQGWKAEQKAKWILRFKGYRILAHRFKTPIGEIDLIAYRGGWYVFIEVKQRSSKIQALEALSPRQQQRISQAAQWYLARHNSQTQSNVRFDLMIFWGWRWSHISHIWSEG